jgi:hypothetical protein
MKPQRPTLLATLAALILEPFLWLAIGLLWLTLELTGAGEDF